MKFFAGLPKETIQKIVTVVMFSAGAVYGITNYYTLRQAGLMREWKSEIQTHQTAIAEVQKMESTARQEASHRQQVESFVADHRNGMISGDPFAWVVREVSLLAENHPVTVSAIRSAGNGKLRLKNQYDTFEADIDVTGGYDQIGQFLAGLENRFATGTIRSLTLTGKPDGHHQASIQFTLLVVPPEKAVGPVHKQTTHQSGETHS